MADFLFSTHAKYMLQERRITEEWVWRTIETQVGKRREKTGIYTLQNQFEKKTAVFYTLLSILTLILKVL
jgi:hypothetical protein